MCARVRLTTDYSELRIKFWVDIDRPAPNLRPSYNIAPTQDLTVLRFDRHTKKRFISALRWGLVPSWAKSPKLDFPTFNARGETVDKTSAFKDSWKQGRRCLVITNGFYEWDKRLKAKQPYSIARTFDEHTVMAGLWDKWRSPQGERLETVTIITTDANDLIRPLHNRMPVILGEEDWAKWLGEEPASEAELKAMLKPYPADKMQLWPVDRRLNNWRNDFADLIRPVPVEKDEPNPSGSLFDPPKR